MKSKSITKQRASTRKDCPRADVPTRGNSPDWYTRENLPYHGENFNSLSSLEPERDVMFAEGVATAAAVMHRTIIHPPVDKFDSFYKKAADFYAEIREKNSGAANYNVLYLAAYMYNTGVLHALAHVVARGIKALRSVMPGSADSPYILSVLAGIGDYEQAASNLASYANTYTVLAKDIENLPLPRVTAFDRSRFLYSSFFADSKNPKPSLISFIPDLVHILVPPETNSPTAAPSEMGTHTYYIQANPGSREVNAIESALSAMQDILERLTSNYHFTIIRGDIRNAFGNSAYWEGLTQLTNTKLELIPEDPETMSQLENLSILPRDSDAGFAAPYVYDENVGQFVLEVRIDGVNDSPGLSRVWLDNNLINYHGSSISDGELLAITRMTYVGFKDNRLTNTVAVITTSSGNTVMYSYLITGVSKNSFVRTLLSASLLQAQASTVQSTMKSAFELLTFAASNIQHFPMLIFGDSPRAYMWNTDNYAIVSRVNLENMGVIANRSLWDVHLPRGANGRLEKRA